MADTNQVTAPVNSVDLKELARILIKHFDVHQGFFETSVSFQMAIGGVGDPASPKPGAIIAVAGVGLSPVPADHPNAVDASSVNPVVVEGAAKVRKGPKK